MPRPPSQSEIPNSFSDEADRCRRKICAFQERRWPFSNAAAHEQHWTWMKAEFSARWQAAKYSSCIRWSSNTSLLRSWWVSQSSSARHQMNSCSIRKMLCTTSKQILFSMKKKQFATDWWLYQKTTVVLLWMLFSRSSSPHRLQTGSSTSL